MADIAGVADFVEEISILQSMFGETVSAAVIASVIESCGGNVHLAADAIMNFSDETTPSQEAASSIDVRPVQRTSLLNVNAQPFELQQPQTEWHQPPSITNQFANLTTGRLEHLGAVRKESPIPAKRTTATEQQQPPGVARQELLNSARPQPLQSQSSILNRQPPSTTRTSSTAEAHTTSFSDAFRNSGALPKKPPDSKPRKPCYTMNIWHDQVGKILHYHNQGTRTLIIMRGVSGSGKSYLAKHIVDYTIGPSTQNYYSHIFSADNYFMRRGVYQFNRDSLQEAHAMNQRQVFEATNKGVSPVIVDNTNTELWEMEPYIRDGVRNGYMIEFVEPKTPWAKNPNQLERRNTHGVPRESIRRMLDRYEKGITPESAIKTLRCEYSSNKKPPVMRNIPPFSLPQSPRELTKKTKKYIKSARDQASTVSRINTTCHETPASPGIQHNVENNPVVETSISSITVNGMLNDEHEIKLKKVIEVQQKIEQFEKEEQEWDNGESWDVTTQETSASSQNSVEGLGSIASEPKPPRGSLNKDNEKLTVENNDWTTFMLPWQDTNITNSDAVLKAPVQVERKSIATAYEVEDLNDHIRTVLIGNPRDINEGIPENNRPKIPKSIVFDKSTSTHENNFLSKRQVCKNKERHFKELRQMFKSVSRQALRDLFESCNFDVNWTVDLVLEYYPGSQDNVNAIGPVSDDEEEEDEGPINDCNCLAGYNLIPDMSPTVENVSTPEPKELSQNSSPLKKPKRENKLSDDSLQLKRQIESNVMIPDNHYSQHFLNWRRRRTININGPDRFNASVSNTDQVANEPENFIGEYATALPEATQNTNKLLTDFRDVAGPSTAYYSSDFLNADDSDSESDSNKLDNIEETVSINLGREFLTKMDELFGRKDFIYPENIQPVLNLPMSILQQINAHWAMSVAIQMDDGSKQTEEMIEQDENFARELANKEQKMSEEGKEPEVPTLKEIMDMELAYSIYERGVAEWRNNEPQDLAARLSREKLYNLFPDLSKDVLSEMLMAHDYSFKATIESLIVSMGQSQWLEDEKGVERYVMQKEMERKEKFLEVEKKNLDEAEWPVLSKQEKPVTLETVNHYREKADRALQIRESNYEKARQYFARNNPAIASFYSEIAALHTRKYDQYSCLAAASLMNYHLVNNPDQRILDLHFLRVAEAMVILDIYLDEVILKLRNKNVRAESVYIITGKGNHSIGGPKIKPAAKRRLDARRLALKKRKDIADIDQPRTSAEPVNTEHLPTDTILTLLENVKSVTLATQHRQPNVD